MPRITFRRKAESAPIDEVRITNASLTGHGDLASFPCQVLAQYRSVWVILYKVFLISQPEAISHNVCDLERFLALQKSA